MMEQSCRPITPEIEIATMQASVDKACGLMKVMSNRDRLILLCQIGQQEKCVSELEQVLEIRQPTLSQQLTVLRDEGLVETRRDGKKIYYRIASSEVTAIMQVLYEQFCKK